MKTDVGMYIIVLRAYVCLDMTFNILNIHVIEFLKLRTSIFDLFIIPWRQHRHNDSMGTENM